MKTLCFCSLLLISIINQNSNSIEYRGNIIINSRYNMDITCLMTDLGNNKWKGEFEVIFRNRIYRTSSSWEGTVKSMSGQMNIAGNSFSWNGKIEDGRFSGTCNNRKYSGTFLMRKVDK